MLPARGLEPELGAVRGPPLGGLARERVAAGRLEPRDLAGDLAELVLRRVEGRGALACVEIKFRAPPAMLSP